MIDDLSDRDRLRSLLERERVTHIIHAGGVSGPMVLADDPAGVIIINVTGSMNLLYAAMDCGVATFVYCSSVAAIGEFYEPEPIGEDYPMRPASAYGCSKAAMDYVLRGLWRKVPLDICSLRLTAVYGPGRQPSSMSTPSFAPRLLASRRASIRCPTGPTFMSMMPRTPVSPRASRTRASSLPISWRIRNASPPTISRRRAPPQAVP